MRPVAGTTSLGPAWLGPVTGALLLALCGCASDARPRPVRPEYDLHDPDPVRRMDAVAAVVRAGDRRYLPALVELLDDPDEPVRLVAIGALRDLTSFDTAYTAYAPREERRAHVRRWRAWLAEAR